MQSAAQRAISPREDDPEGARRLAAALGVRPLTARLLINRGVVDEERARRFLEPRLGHLRAPEEADRAMAGFTRAAERLASAILDGDGAPIGVFGDYDVDGVTSCALVAGFVRGCGARAIAKVARRDAGYGLSVATVEEMAAAGCRLLVTGDCGTSDHEALARARSLGLDVIVVDHHQVPDRDPGAFALLNPHQAGCRFPFKGLASVGVAFYLAASVRTRLLGSPRFAGRALPDPRELLDLVAIGTVADLVPLTDENRVLVAAGLRELSRARRPGVRALLEAAGLDPALRAPAAVDIGFKLGPLINAPGRMGEAQRALDLLLAEEPGAASTIAKECQEANQRRREVQEAVFAAACAQLDADPEAAAAPVIVAAGEGWHPGVVGIVAAKLVERTGRPSIAIALEGEVGRGSARTCGGFDLFRALRAAGDHLVRYGGHAAAAGLTVERERIPSLRRALAAAHERHSVERALGGGGPERWEARAEAEVSLEEVDEQLAAEFARLGPFGVGNPEPVLVAHELSVERTRVVGERHLQLVLRQGPYACDGIGFNFVTPGAPLGPRLEERGARVRASFVPEIDTFRGERRLRLRLRALEPL